MKLYDTQEEALWVASWFPDGFAVGFSLGPEKGERHGELYGVVFMERGVDKESVPDSCVYYGRYHRLMQDGSWDPQEQTFLRSPTVEEMREERRERA